MNKNSGNMLWSPLVSLRFPILLLLFAQVFLAGSAFGAGSYKLKSNIEGDQRIARIFEGKLGDQSEQPLVFAFHGYGDNRTDFSRFVELHRSWPEAIVVYPEGLKLLDNNGKLRKKGWQTRVGALNNRDLKYLDFLLKELSGKYSINKNRTFATGFSNGARFVFLLMEQRADTFAAFAPVGSAMREGVTGELIKPKPIIYIIGKDEQPATIKAALATVEVISEVNRSSTSQTVWAVNYILFQAHEGGADFVFNLHRGGHVWPYEASDMIVRFFKDNPMPTDGRLP